MNIQDRHGNHVSKDDPDRLLWYSAMCGYWTDDWDMLRKFGVGIPCCPVCGCPGMQIEARKWEEGAIAFDAQDPGYLAFLAANKEKCFRPDGFMAAWKAHKAGGTA